jgi:hypothetical protein
MIVESLVGGLIGGLLRLAPELLKFFDRKNDRAHEAVMFDKEVEVTRLRMEAQIQHDRTSLDIASIDAIAVAAEEQGRTARAAGKFVAALSALVRPLVTYYFVVLYSIVKSVGLWLLYTTGADVGTILEHAWTADDVAILSMILVFWFVGRVYDRSS